MCFSTVTEPRACWVLVEDRVRKNNFPGYDTRANTHKANLLNIPIKILLRCENTITQQEMNELSCELSFGRPLLHRMIKCYFNEHVTPWWWPNFFETLGHFLFKREEHLHCNGEDLISVWSDFLFASQSNLTVVYRPNVNQGDWPVRVSRRHFQGDVLLLRKPQIEYKPKQPRWAATKNISWFHIQ